MNLEQAKTYAEKMSYSQAAYNALCGYGIPYRKATKIKLNELLDVAKNIDAKHAHWIYGYTFPDGQYRKCSACKELIKVVPNDGNFCGHCGAKMDGGRQLNIPVNE